MKISYRTHPVLEKLAKKSILSFDYYKSDKDFIVRRKENIVSAFKKISLGINNQIYYVTQPFVDAYERAGDKLFGAGLWSDVEDDNICFLLPKNEATLLNIRNNTEKKLITCSAIGFVINGNTLGYCTNLFVDYSGEGIPERYAIGWESENVENVEGNIFNLILMTLFIKYANVETKIMPPGFKEKSICCNYKNETDLRVIQLDSKWFTTLVKSDAFQVRGHFRLQPKKKDGVQTKELIWINDFMKGGYTAPARKDI